MENNEEAGGGGGADTGSFKCQECNSIFKRRDHLGRHMMTQHDENSQRTKCPLKDCDTEMVRRDHLRRHISQVHKVDPSEVLPYSRRKPSLKKSGSFDPLKRFKCVFDGCDAELSRKDHLCRHIKNIHKADPRQVIGHMYKTPRPSSTESCSGGSPITTPTSTSPGKSKRRSSSKKKRDSSNANDNTPTMTNHSSDNHHQGHHQSHASTLSDYDYGADFDYAGLKVEREDEDEDDNVDAALYLDNYEKEEDAVLCIICCYSFYPEEQPQPRDNLSKSLHFNKFIAEILPKHSRLTAHSRADLLSCVDRISLCPDCLPLVNIAMERKLVVDDMEIKVRKLQRQLLAEIGTLEQRLEEYTEEMRGIESIVNCSDISCLESYLRKNVVFGRSQENSLVLLMRDGIVAAVDKLKKCNGLVETFGIKSLFGDYIDISSCDEEDYTYDKVKIEAEAEESINDKEGTSDEDGNNVGGEGGDPGQTEITNVSQSQGALDDNVDTDTDPTAGNSNGNAETCSGKEVEQMTPNGCPTVDIDEECQSQSAKKKRISKDEKLSCADKSNWTDFKKKLFKKIKKESRNRASLDSSCLSQQADVPNPILDYIPETNNFAVGNVALIVNDEENLLECSMCSFRTMEQDALSAAVQQMQEHIQLNHLSCPDSHGEGGHLNNPSKSSPSRKGVDKTRKHQTRRLFSEENNVGQGQVAARKRKMKPDSGSDSDDEIKDV